MPINPALLIAAPMLQDALVDKFGRPMSAGTVTCYQDNSRTTLKNWFYQIGTPGNYSYLPLPNPLTLSAAGTISDINGVDTIPFFYPYSELDEDVSQPYFITIYNHDRTDNITRANFPFITGSGSSQIGTDTLHNLIVNNGFWRNLLPNYVNTTLTSITLNTFANGSGVVIVAVAPSQHDALAAPDIIFNKNNISANDFLTFTPFPLANELVIPKPPTVTSEYYINHQCTSMGTAEVNKFYQFPICAHLNNLANVPFTVTIQAQNMGGIAVGQNQISLFIDTFTGIGTTSPDPLLIGGLPITLNSTWTTYVFTDVFPSTAGLTLSTAEDDGFYLRVQMPTNTQCNINFTKPSVYLTTGIFPVNDFQTYDQINAIISSPRTGDIRMSLNGFVPGGWVPANDGTIGNSSSHATTRAFNDTWPLFRLLWDNVSNTFAPLVNSSGTPISRGANAFADFSANNAITLTQTLSRVLGSVGPGAGLTNWALGQTSGGESTSTTLTIDNMPAHNHPGSFVSLALAPLGTNSTGFNTAVINTAATAVSVAIEGSGTAFLTSNIQPSVFYNVFFKL
jgi:hypothetical protein